jgi:hypothetical protein
MAELYGKPKTAVDEGYSGGDDYSGQGDTRIVRDLMFSYMAASSDPSGITVLEPVDCYRGEEISVEQMGLIAQEKGERLHSFYTDAEREALESGADPNQPLQLTSGSSLAEMGEYELAEYIQGSNPEGKKLSVDETVALAGTDKDLAHRLLQAENVATDGDPRAGVEKGLTAIIES